MPSNKDKVASYLETDEVQALDKFCKEKDCSRSQGVAYLIKERLVESEELARCYSEKSKSDDNRILQNEEIAKITNQVGHHCLFLEKLQEKISFLEEDVSRLKTEIKESTIHYLSDEQIASVTGRRLQDVYDWRMGVRKPRGKNILAKLNPYEIIDGQWRKKRVSEHLKSVQQSVQHF